MSSTEIRCAYCTRWRVREDVFWHRFDRKWYCCDIGSCEARFRILAERWCREQDALTAAAGGSTA